MKTMSRLSKIGIVSGVLLLSIAALASAQRAANQGRLVVPKGTQVIVTFDQALSSKTTKVGQSVRLHVTQDVQIGGETVIGKGARVQGVISQVTKRQNYGRNAEMRLILHSVRSLNGKMIPLEASGKGDEISGRKSAQAAGATVGGAVVLGPIGLVGGYFIHGKPVTIKVGDAFVTEVSKDVVLRRR